MSTIDIRTIKILLDTNIPGKEIIPLTKSVLYQPDKPDNDKTKNESDNWVKESSNWNEIPYFTMDAAYPEGFLSTLPYVKQMEFFFNKQKMKEIIQIKSKIATAQQIDDGLTSKEIEQRKNIKDTIQKLEAQKKIKQADTQLEIDTELKKINEEEQNSSIKIESSFSTKLHNLDCRTIEKIEGKPVNSILYSTAGYTVDKKQYKSFEEYLTFKNTDIINKTDNYKKIIDEMISLTKIKEIFKPNSEYLDSKGFFGIGGNKNKLDTDGLYNDQFCKIDSLKERFPPYLFANNRSNTITWNSPLIGSSYKDELLTTLKSMNSSPLFEIPEVNDIIKRITDINDKDIKLEYDEKWIETDKNLCLLLPEIRQAFLDMNPKLIEIQNKLYFGYPDTAIKNLESLKIEYTNKKTEIEQQNKTEKEQLSLSLIDQKTKVQSDKIVGGGDSSNDPITDEIMKNDIAEKNIMIMIRLLFPTKYPIIGNIFSSFHSVVTGQNEFHLKWTDFIPSIFKEKLFEGMSDYSYIKMNGNTYTVIQAIWLNDIYNHNEYKKLVDQFEELQKWKNKEARKSESVLLKRRDFFLQTYNSAEFQINDIDIENIKKTLKSLDSRNRSAEYSLANYRLSIEELIKSMNEIIKAKKLGNIDRLIESSKNFAAIYLELEKTQSFNPTDKVRYEKIAQRMKDDTDKIQTDEHILKNYLQSPGINMDYERDKYRQTLEQKYSLYVRFVENIRKYRAPVLESSNHFLQSSIDDFLDKTEKYKGVFNFFMNRLNIKKNPYSEMISKNTSLNMRELEDIENEEKQYLNRLNTGITIRPSAQINEPYYEIYIQLNLIGGELNDSNKSVIDCMFQGESLGDKLSRILNEAIYNPWDINSSRVFFDITQGAAKDVLDNNKNNKQILGSEKKGGAKKSIRKYRELFMRSKTYKSFR